MVVDLAQADSDGRVGMAGSKGGNGRPSVVLWDEDSEKVIPTLGRLLSSLGTGVRPNCKISRRLDLGWQKR